MILSSGVQYDSASIEFRLALLHCQRQNDYRRLHDAQIIDLLSSVFFASAVRKLTDDSREKILDFAKNESKQIFNLLALKDEPKVSEKQKRKAEEKHLTGQQAYATALAQVGKFSSIDQLQAAIAALNDSINESIRSSSS